MIQSNSYNGNRLDSRIPTNLEEFGMNAQTNLVDFIDTWLTVFKSKTVKAASFERLKQSRNSLMPYPIAKMAIGEIGFFDVQLYVNSLVEAGYSMSSLKKQLLIVTAPLKQAAAMKIISCDPSVGVQLPIADAVQKKAREINAYAKPEQKAMADLVSANKDNTGYIAALFMLETGIRSGELLALKWSDVDISQCKLRIHATIVNPMSDKKSVYQDSPKSASSKRTIPLTPKALILLKTLQLRRTTEWVFEQDGKRYTYKKLMYQTKKLCSESGVPYYGEHAFRHTFATNCYYKGIDVKILSKLLGHSSVQVTYNTYIHLYGDGFDTMYAALCF
jgi:integrase